MGKCLEVYFQLNCMLLESYNEMIVQITSDPFEGNDLNA